jgi:hypothetical protein
MYNKEYPKLKKIPTIPFHQPILINLLFPSITQGCPFVRISLFLGASLDHVYLATVPFFLLNVVPEVMELDRYFMREVMCCAVAKIKAP